MSAPEFLRARRHPIVEQDLDRILSAALPWGRFGGKTVLVTGAAGFLPAYIVESLLRMNETGLQDEIRLVGVVRTLEKGWKRFGQYLGRHDLTLIQQDVSSPWNFGGKLDFIIHAASQASPKHFGEDPVGVLDSNILGTRHALERALKDGSEGVLYFSSGEVYGQTDPARISTSEDSFGTLDPTDVRACYGEGKRAGEALCVAFAHQYKVPAMIVRPFHTYGPGMALDDGRVFADFVSDIVKGNDIVMKSEGLSVRTFCYLADAAEGFLSVLLNGKPGLAYNVGNPAAETSVRNLANLLVRIFPDPPKRVVYREREQGSRYMESPISRISPDISRIRAIGWTPVTGLEDGFRRTVQSFQGFQQNE